jgi:predicted MFS family arabinose efflux permease
MCCFQAVVQEHIHHDLLDSLFSNNIMKLVYRYMFAMGVCGFIIVALGTTLSGIAANVGYSAYDIGTVFVARGVGCISGTMASSVLYGQYHGKHMLCVTSVMTVLILYWMPYCTDYYLLHGAYFALGMITSVTETGSQLMMIKFHGPEAGPWCGANSMAFCISGIIVPAVQMITTDLHVEYNCYAAFVAFSALWVILCPDPEKNGRILPQTSDSEGNNAVGSESQHYIVEMLIAVMIFLMIGGGETMMFYMKIYVNDTGVIPPDDGSLIFLMFFVAVTVGKLIGIVDQAYLTNNTIVMHFFVLLMGSAVSLAAIWYYPDDANTLWVGIICFGLCQGPAISYCFDLCNRLALCSEVSISILMLGMNLGVSMVPYSASLLWTNSLGPMAIIDVGIITMLACIPVLFIAPRMSYLKSIPYIGLVSLSSQAKQSHAYSPINPMTTSDDRDMEGGLSTYEATTRSGGGVESSFQQGEGVSL